MKGACLIEVISKMKIILKINGSLPFPCGTSIIANGEKSEIPSTDPTYFIGTLYVPEQKIFYGNPNFKIYFLYYYWS